MKILFISNMYPSTQNPSYGIFVKNTYDLLKGNHNIKLIVLKKHKINLVKVVAYLSFYIKSIIAGIIQNYDCIYAHFISHCELPVKIIKYFRKDIVVVGNVHGEDVFSDFEEFQGNMRKAHEFMKRASYIIVPSQFFKEKINQVYGFSSESIYVSPSGGIDTKIFYPDVKFKCREYLGLEQDAYYIGYVSRIEQGKGWDTFLKAFYNLLHTGVIKNIKAIIVGKGSEEAKLYAMIKKMGIENHIKLYPLVSQNELHFLYNSFSLFCFPTRINSESLGLVGLEAMACKIPCVIADADGPMSYVEAGKNALVFDKNSATDLEKKILQIYKMNSVEKHTMINVAYQTAKKYSTSKVGEQLLEFFDRVERGIGSANL